MKREVDEEAEAFLEGTQERKKVTKWARSWAYARIVLEIGMAATVIFLLFFRAPPSRTLRRSPVPDRTSIPPEKTVHFLTI
jgi:hypothetical protein